MCLDTTFSAFDVVQFNHTFNLRKFHTIAILERMTFVLMHCDDQFIFVAGVNRSDDVLLGRLSIFIEHNVGITEIDECVSSDTHSLSHYKSAFVRSSSLVEVHKTFDSTEVFSEDSAFVALHVSGRELRYHVDFDVRVQFSELSERSFSAGNFTNVLLSQVEVRSQVSLGGDGRIVKSHCSRAS